MNSEENSEKRIAGCSGRSNRYKSSAITDKSIACLITLRYNIGKENAVKLNSRNEIAAVMRWLLQQETPLWMGIDNGFAGLLCDWNLPCLGRRARSEDTQCL
ncbi:hypothetical protein [Selenomonas sp. GACV-9]|uniref:hypothetical protein n=1 Tax=Selenomonas sp. GACV-9 TaxID=3158782 RepID=UPI0015A65EA0